MSRRQIQLRELGYQVYLQKRPVIIVFEGWDAAGKGGAIKRITEKLDPRGYVVYPISAPHGEDKTRHYLYRFWRRLPERGQIAIFDRSWYGRVLVERVEGFAWKANGSAPTRKSTPSSGNCATSAPFWRSSGSTSRARNSFAASKSAKPSATRPGSLPMKTGAIAQKWGVYEEAVEEMLVKTSTSGLRPGPWSKATTSTGPEPRCWRKW